MLLKHRPIRLPIDREYFMSLVSGSESGVATTAAIIAGLATGTNNQSLVVTSGVIAMLVQAFNGAVGRLSSEHTQDEIDRDGEETIRKPLLDSVLQLATHVSMSVLVLLPVAVFDELENGVVGSVSIALVLLFITGLFKGRFVKSGSLRDALTSLTLGAVVISVGTLAGLALN